MTENEDQQEEARALHLEKGDDAAGEPGVPRERRGPHPQSTVSTITIFGEHTETAACSRRLP